MKVEVIMQTTATRKGQIVIPADLRRKYGIKEGTRIRVADEDNRIVLTPITSEYVQKLRGVLKEKRAMKILVQERKKEREL
jgi:AbrB family looped-hinge helix DNA binding protein